MRAIGLLVIVFIGGIGSTHAQAALEDKAWFRYTSANFEFYSNRPSEEVAEQIENLELFRAVVSRLTGVREDVKYDHTTKIFLFKNVSVIGKLFKKRQVGGFLRPGVRGNLLVVGDNAHLRGAYEIAFHEYVHYIMRNASAFRYPAWYDEGFAELLSTVRREDGMVIFGEPPVARAATWLYERRLPLKRVLETTHTGALSRINVPQFYAASWLFVHYVTLSPDGREFDYPAKNIDYLQRINAGEDRLLAFEQAFGISIDTMNKRLKAYAKTGLPVYENPDSRYQFDSSYESVRLTRDEIAYELAYSAINENPKGARRMLKKTVKNNPNDMRALAGLGVTYQVEKQFDTAVPMIQRALDGAPSDYLLHIEYADVLEMECRAKFDKSRCVDPATGKTMLHHYQRAHTLAPELLETNVGYAYHLSSAGRCDESIPLLNAAFDLLPSHYATTKLLGVCYLATEQYPAAETALRRALGWSADAPKENQRVAELLEVLRKTEDASTQVVEGDAG